MATVNKDFKVKHGLIVEGENATVDGSDIITADSITAGNGEGGNENVTVSYDAETKKVTFAAAPGYSDEDVKDVLTGSTQTNISITEVEGVLTITAENGVEDSTTDDLDEGTTNKYFTDQRALDATASAYDVAGAAASAQTAAEDYADGLAVNYDVAGAAAAAQTAAEDYADGLAANYDAAGSAATAEQNAIAHADALVQGLDVKESVVTASTANVDITINASGGIGGVAFANGDRVLLKNQTNIAENGIYIYSSATQTIVASTDPADEEIGKGSYVLVTGGTNAATGWIVTNTSGGDTWTQFSAANEYTAGTGITIDANAISVTADTYDAYGAAAQALSDAEDYADGLETDDIEEGDTNLYFTNTRAVDALEAVVPDFTAIEVNSVAKQVAATVSAPTAVQTVAYAFAKATYRSAKFLVKVAYSTHTEVSEVLLTLDTSDNIAITEFAIVSTNGSASAISAGINSANVELLVTPTNASSTITVVGTLLA